MEVFKALEAAADVQKAAAMSAYLKNNFTFLGIQKPRRTALTKSFLARKKKQPPDWDFVHACYARRAREFHYLAVDYVQAIMDKLGPEDLGHIEWMITHNSWWDTVDALTKPVGRMFITYPQIKETLLRWTTSGNLWLRRISIIFQLHLKQQTDTALLALAIEKNLGTKEFFINKAIGWALREYSKTDPDWVRVFLAAHRLAPLSVREASKYI